MDRGLCAGAAEARLAHGGLQALSPLGWDMIIRWEMTWSWRPEGQRRKQWQGPPSRYDGNSVREVPELERFPFILCDGSSQGNGVWTWGLKGSGWAKGTRSMARNHDESGSPFSFPTSLTLSLLPTR